MGKLHRIKRDFAKAVAQPDMWQGLKPAEHRTFPLAKEGKYSSATYIYAGVRYDGSHYIGTPYSRSYAPLLKQLIKDYEQGRGSS